MDRALLDAINRVAASPALDTLMVGLTLALPALLLLPLLWWREGRRADTRALCSAMIVALVATLIVQFAAGRVRPDAVRLVITTPGFPSFPSGHAAIAAAFATFVALRDRSAAIAAGALAFGIGLSRVYLGHHYPSDVLIGWTIGASCGAMAHGFTVESSDRPRWAWLLWGQLALCFLAIISATLELTKFSVLLLPGADKVLHFVLFGILGLLCAGWVSPKAGPKILLVLATLATIEELSQGWVSTRTFDLIDLACTLSGIAIVGSIGVVLRRRVTRSAERTVHMQMSPH